MQDWQNHDWRNKVGERLEPCGLPPENHDEVVSEFAAHLAETYDDARSRGLTEAAAVECTLQEVSDWRVLAAHIRRATSREDPMTTRTKSLWLPAMVNLLGAMGLLMLLQKGGLQPRLLWVSAAGGQFAMAFYFPWLITLPLFGAAGAYMARRARASSIACLAAGLSPGLTLTALIGLLAPFGLLIDGWSIYRLVIIAAGLLTWGVLPAIALLLGALPFLGQPALLKTYPHSPVS